MNNKLKRASSFLLATILILLAVFISACGKSKQGADKGDSADEIARIGDESINMPLYLAAFDSYAEYWKQMGMDPFTSEKEVENFQDIVLDALLSDIVVLHHAKAEGYALDDEEKAEVAETAKDELQLIRDDYMKLAEEANKQDPSLSVEQHFENLISELAEYYTGKKMDFDEYSEEYTRELENSKLIEKFQEAVCAEFKVSDTAIEEWYVNQLEVDKKLYAEAPEQFKNDMEYYELYAGSEADAYPPTFVPEGYSRIMDIVVSPEDEPGEEYKNKLEELNRIGEECSALLFSDALNGTSDNAERIEKLLEDYKTLESETGEIYDSYMKPAREKIEKAYSELENGASFEEVMERYSDDSSARSRLISLEYKCENDWSGTVKEIYAMTNEGEYSSIFTDEDGRLHIIFHGDPLESGEVKLENIKSDVEKVVRASSEQTEWRKLVDAWLEDSELKVDREAIRSIGKENLEKTDNDQ